ncbi:MAG TPA: IS1 family transposase [Candidatus Angelobacter sp.]|nr:IS1 family transposase [Candidatus Angelobacter sp.]
MNRLSAEKRTRVVMALIEGNSVRSTCRMTGVAKGTVLSLIANLGMACAAYHDKHVRNVAAKRVQCDEVWSFCYGKDKNVSDEQKAEGAGSVWTWTALDADSKLIISYLCGGRDASWGMSFMEDLASRVSTRIQITTDGHRVYADAVEGTFGMDVDYAMLIKLYGSPAVGDTRYSPGEVIGIETKVLSGNPDSRHISTSYVERQNLTMRMSMRRFTRLTNGFSKKLENHEHMLAIYFMYYNFCRVHQTLRVTPAMEAGLTDHVWTVAELVNLMEPKSILEGLKQTA